MSLKEKLLKAVQQTADLAGTQVAAGLDRADEFGGELRDYLLTRTDQPVLRKLGEKLATLGGVQLDENSGPSSYEESLAKAAAAAPPPTADEVTAAAAQKGLGDRDIAAQIYGRKSCPWTGRAITLLNNGKVDFDFVDLDDSENGRFEGPLNAETGQNTVPYVYLRGEFVGGYNELNEVVRLGRLEYRILSRADQNAADAAERERRKS